MNTTLKRGLTGIFIIAFILFPILFVEKYFWVFTIVFTLITFFSVLEFYTLIIKSNKACPLKYVASLAAALFFVVSSLWVFIGLSPLAFLIPILLLSITLTSEIYRKNPKPFDTIAYTLLGIIWIALPLSLMNFFFIKGIYQGSIFIPLLAVFIFSWVNDTGAYLVGINFGKTRLFERISPKKSWEGTIGGIFFTIIAAYVMSLFWDAYGFYTWLIFALITAISGIYGDLSESLFKREINCKDSGNIMPGHGGFLDRFDCIFFAVPVVLVFLLVKHYVAF